MGYLKFSVKATDKKTDARVGKLKVKSGIIETPAFVPVATKATVKTLSSEELQQMGAQILICNTFHLMLKPGEKTVKKAGGLHNFMNWKGPLMTDSGGFQAFSLGLGQEHATGKMSLYFPEDAQPGKKKRKGIAKIDENGVTFKSIYDNSLRRLTPESSIKIQEDLGADIIFALDECTSPLSDYSYTKKSLQRTHNWAERCIKSHKTKQALIGIVQGGHWEDLRLKSAEFIASKKFDGIAIGGSLGKRKSDMHKIIEWTTPLLPENKPRHLLGIGVIEDIFEVVERGIDLFDCVGPTRIARAGYVYVKPPTGKESDKFRYRITKQKFATDNKPLDKKCDCCVCKNYTKMYVNHLFKSKELLAYRLVSYHNLYFFIELMKGIREAIKNGKFMELKKKWLK